MIWLRELIYKAIFTIISFIKYHWITIIAIISILFIITISFMNFLEWQAAAALLQGKDRIQVENENFKTLAQILGGLVVIIGLYFTRKTIIVSQESQITQRFNNAIEHLGDDKLAKRLGALYALERIARDSNKDYWPIMEVITAFIRENTTFSEDRKHQLETGRIADVQAALTIIGRRVKSYKKGEEYRLSLVNSDLSRLQLINAQMIGINLTQARLDMANLTQARLDMANLTQARLVNADLTEASLEAAILNKADFG